MIRQKNLKEPKSYKIVACARSGYGKTSMCIEFIKALVLRGEIAPQRVIIFSRTVKSEPKQRELVDWLQQKCNERSDIRKSYNYAEDCTSKEIKYEFLQILYDHNVKKKESDEQYNHWLIWFDDQISDSSIRHGVPQILRLYGTEGRHYALSQIWGLQTYRSGLDPMIREQITNFWFGDLLSQDAKQDVISQFSSNYDKDNPEKSAKTLLRDCETWVFPIEDRHGILNVHAERSLGDGRFELRFWGIYLDKEPFAQNFKNIEAINGIIEQRKLLKAKENGEDRTNKAIKEGKKRANAPGRVKVTASGELHFQNQDDTIITLIPQKSRKRKRIQYVNAGGE